MAISGDGITFNPLFWVFNDQWQYYVPNGEHPIVYNHWGHLHFFMLGLDFKATSSDAFTGKQQYNFSISDEWGPRSSDPNQALPYRIVGTPKWFYHVTELWRRVFVQPWDEGGNSHRGVRYDCCPPENRMGPFREGIANQGANPYAPYWMSQARGLPVDHFTTGAHTQGSRENHLADRARGLLGLDYIPGRFEDRGGGLAFSHGGAPANVPPFPDSLYIFPIIEYQKVVQLNWEILPGSNPDVNDPADAANDYGDGWDSKLTIPFIDPVSLKYRSPFGTEPGVVTPFGQYNESAFAGGRKLVPLDKRFRYNTPSYGDVHPYDDRVDEPVEKADALINTWNNPWGDQSGGKIVQQCLGGVVLAKAKVILEHKLGGRFVTWVTATQYLPVTDFEGSDQKLPQVT